MNHTDSEQIPAEGKNFSVHSTEDCNSLYRAALELKKSAEAIAEYCDKVAENFHSPSEAVDEIQYILTDLGGKNDSINSSLKIFQQMREAIKETDDL